MDLEDKMGGLAALMTLDPEELADLLLNVGRCLRDEGQIQRVVEFHCKWQDENVKVLLINLLAIAASRLIQDPDYMKTGPHNPSVLVTTIYEPEVGSGWTKH